MCKRMVITEIASLLKARENCIASGNDKWFEEHSERLEKIAEDCLPTGSGFNAGTKIDLDKSRENKVYLTTSYQFARDGFWKHYKIVVTPSLMNGFNLRIIGESVDDIKEYITDIFYDALGQS